jgi:hypothetical protein
MDEPSDNMFPNVYSKTNGTGSPSINSMKNVNDRRLIRTENINEKKKRKQDVSYISQPRKANIILLLRITVHPSKRYKTRESFCHAELSDPSTFHVLEEGIKVFNPTPKKTYNQVNSMLRTLSFAILENVVN